MISKTIRRALALALALLAILPAPAQAAREVFDNELEAAEAFAAHLAQGQTVMDVSVPADFDYAQCYRYLSMLYRDACVFEYVPSLISPYMKIIYNDARKHEAAEAEAARLADELLDDSMGPREQYAAIYGYLIGSCSYDRRAALNQSVEIGDAFSAYGALIDGLAVCDGLSAAFAMICRHAGLPCLYIASNGMNHSWNAVLYKGEVLYADLTYDITGGTADRYFLVDEATMLQDHSWDREALKRLTDDVWDERFIAAWTLNRLGGLFRGSDLGWELDRSPTRAEAAIMLVRFLGLEAEALAQSGPPSYPFEDVNPNHAPYIDMLWRLGLTKGTSGTTFSPQLPVRLNDYMTFMLRALEYSEEKDQFAWESAAEDALGLSVIDQRQYDRLTRGGFDRGLMACVSLLTLTAEDPMGVPLWQRLCDAGAIDQKIVEELLF